VQPEFLSQKLEKGFLGFLLLISWVIRLDRLKSVDRLFAAIVGPSERPGVMAPAFIDAARDEGGAKFSPRLQFTAEVDRPRSTEA
jgi:hypothetical protein